MRRAGTSCEACGQPRGTQKFGAQHADYSPGSTPNSGGKYVYTLSREHSACGGGGRRLLLSLLPEALRQLGSLRRHVALEKAGRVLHGGGKVAQLEHELLHVVQLEERPLLGAEHAQGEAEEGPQRTWGGGGLG